MKLIQVRYSYKIYATVAIAVRTRNVIHLYSPGPVLCDDHLNVNSNIQLHTPTIDHVPITLFFSLVALITGCHISGIVGLMSVLPTKCMRAKTTS